MHFLYNILDQNICEESTSNFNEEDAFKYSTKELIHNFAKTRQSADDEAVRWSISNRNRWIVLFEEELYGGSLNLAKNGERLRNFGVQQLALTNPKMAFPAMWFAKKKKLCATKITLA